MSSSLSTTPDKDRETAVSAAVSSIGRRQQCITWVLLTICLLIIGLDLVYILKREWIDRLGKTEIEWHVNELVQVATENIQRGHHEVAITNLKEALDLDPAAGNAMLVMGEAYAAMGEEEKAVTLFQKSLNHDPPLDDRAYVNLGQICASRNNFDKALDFFRRAVEQASDPSDVLSRIGGLYLRVGRPDYAEAVLRKALAELGNMNTQYRGALIAGQKLHYKKPALVSRIKQKLDGVISREELALYDKTAYFQWKMNSPAAAGIYDLLGRSLVLQGKYDEGRTWLTKSLEVQKRIHGDDHFKLTTPLINLAEACKSKGRYDEAERLYHQALQFQIRELGDDHRDTTVTLAKLGRIHFLQGHYEKAGSVLKQALTNHENAVEKDPRGLVEVLKIMNNIYRATGNDGEADKCEKRIRFISSQLERH